MSSTRWVEAEAAQDAPDRAQEHRGGFYCHGNAKKHLETLKAAQAGLRFLQQEASPVGKRQMVQKPDSSSSAGSRTQTLRVPRAPRECPEPPERGRAAWHRWGC